MNMIADEFLKDIEKRQHIGIAENKIELKITNNIEEQVKWLKLFKDDYQGKTENINSRALAIFSYITPCYVLKVNNEEIGFIRLVHKGKVFKVTNSKSLDAVYIKPEYRKQGIYKYILKKLINDYGVNMITLGGGLEKTKTKFFNEYGFYEYVYEKGKQYLIHKTTKYGKGK